MWYLENLENRPVKTFQVPTSAEPARVSNVQGVGSYSWVARGSSVTLAIPASPPQWREPRFPLQVPPDSGLIYIDQNAARCDVLRVSPLTPIFLALDTLHPKFIFGEVDLITDRNNLRKLLRWATGNVEKAFRIEIQLGGTKSIIFTRIEEKTTESIPSGQFRGYGHTFEHAVTRPTTAGSTGHHRLITYNLLGRKVLLRFEVDACIPPAISIDELTRDLKGIGIAQSVPSGSNASSSSTPRIPITKTGTKVVDQGSLIELKTMSQNKSVNWPDTYPQLQLSGTPYLYVAKHSRGSFVALEKHNLQQKAQEYYARNTEQALGKVCKLLDDILTILKEERNKGGKFALVCTEVGELKLHKRRYNTNRDVTETILSKFGGEIED